eukprot:7957778-Pyramimonas_sp.AAC.1
MYIRTASTIHHTSTKTSDLNHHKNENNKEEQGPVAAVQNSCETVGRRAGRGSALAGAGEGPAS